jgi:hypothetical protein
MENKKKTIVESIILLIFSFVVLFEGLRLARRIGTGLLDVMGPGTYIIILGAILIFITLIHIMLYSRRLLRQKQDSPGNAEASQGEKVNFTVLLMVAILALYIALVQIIGYPIATPIYFLLMFRAVGVTSWGRNVMLTVILSGSYYLIFVHYLEVIFPRGLLFG